MGEAADDAIDRGVDEWLNEEYDVEGYSSIRLKTCQNCGAHGFQWGQEKGKWRLFDAAGELHVCKPLAKKVFK